MILTPTLAAAAGLTLIAASSLPRATPGSNPEAADSCRAAVITPRASVHRGLPHEFHDQGRASLNAIYPGHRLLAARRTAAIARVEYALLVYQATASDPVSLSALAVEWATSRAWGVEARCPIDAWPDGLISVMEALAALPEAKARRGADPGSGADP